MRGRRPSWTRPPKTECPLSAQTRWAMAELVRLDLGGMSQRDYPTVQGSVLTSCGEVFPASASVIEPIQLPV